MALIKITSENFDSEVINSNEKIMLDFWASWCGPCRMTGMAIDSLMKENPDVKIGKVNVDEEPSISNRFGIMNIPTLVVMENGKETKRAVGSKTKSELLEFIK